MKVLAVGCHPDDIEIHVGGTIRKYVARGDEVYTCHVANGNLGHKIIMPDELAKIRHDEAERASQTLGVVKCYDLDMPDQMFSSYDNDLRMRMTAIIKEVGPDVIITHAPDDYMTDHREVSKLVFDCSFAACCDHFDWKPSVPVAPIYYMDNLAGVGFGDPDFYVDIGDEIETKLQALQCHESQIIWMRDHDHIDFVDFVRTCSHYRGLQCGVQYAEGFKQCHNYERMNTRPLLP